MRGKRVLVTGGLGFIGSNLVHELLRRDARVTVYDNLDPQCGGNSENLDPIATRVELVAEDIRNFDRLSGAVRDKDYIFHCAARTSHSGSMTEPFADIEVNCTGTMNLLEAARRFAPGAKIVHVGTITQIGKHVVPEVTELHPEFPLDISSANKTASEKYVLIYGAAHGLRTTVVRLANTFGPRANIRGPAFGFVNYFIGLALQNKELTVFGDGTQRRNISYVQDSVEALILAAENDGANGQVLFAVADRQITVAAIAAAIAQHIGGIVRFVAWPADRAAIEIGDAVISNARIRDLLGWRPQIAIEHALEITKQYYQLHASSYLDG